ncbi:tail fiber assembly protein [Erwinia sp. PK3-005]|uniref:Tail fiber assembly protein n=1 Tax=Mixta hanseatica TaxID=2872648 RepID=A0ABY4R5Y8_9GAMM|nr:tail fiber assembly protein [Mixta hanseatica]UQY42638.1 tail fiber assembly protein [Mixta hanseatica]
MFDKWNGEKWVTDSDAQRTAAVSTAETACITEANSATQAWQTQLRIDIISDAEKASLTVWMKYVQNV